MSYVLEKVLKGLRTNSKVYLILFIELVLCFSLSFLAINQWLIRQERDRVIEAQTLNRIFVDNKSQRPINIDDLKIMESSLKDEETLIYAKNSPLTIINDQDISDINSYIVNDSFLDKYIPQQKSKNSLLTTHESFEKDLKDGRITILDLDLTIKNKEIMLNGKIINVQKIENIESHFLITSSQQLLDFPLTNALFIPAGIVLEDNNYHQNNGVELIAVMDSNRPRQEVISELNQVTQNRYKFIDKQVLEQYKSGTDDLTEMIDVFGFCGIVSLFIICVGIIGLFYIFMDQRKKSMIVSRLFGASKLMIFLELFLELFVISMTASLISGLIVYIIQPHLSSVYFNLYMTHSALIFMVTAPFLISFITLLMLKSDVNELSEYMK